MSKRSAPSRDTLERSAKRPQPIDIRSDSESLPDLDITEIYQSSQQARRGDQRPPNIPRDSGYQSHLIQTGPVDNDDDEEEEEEEDDHNDDDDDDEDENEDFPMGFPLVLDCMPDLTDAPSPIREPVGIQKQNVRMQCPSQRATAGAGDTYANDGDLGPSSLTRRVNDAVRLGTDILDSTPTENHAPDVLEDQEVNNLILKHSGHAVVEPIGPSHSGLDHHNEPGDTQSPAQKAREASVARMNPTSGQSQEVVDDFNILAQAVDALMQLPDRLHEAWWKGLSMEFPQRTLEQWKHLFRAEVVPAYNKKQRILEFMRQDSERRGLQDGVSHPASHSGNDEPRRRSQRTSTPARIPDTKNRFSSTRVCIQGKLEFKNRKKVSIATNQSGLNDASSNADGRAIVPPFAIAGPLSFEDCDDVNIFTMQDPRPSEQRNAQHWSEAAGSPALSIYTEHRKQAPNEQMPEMPHQGPTQAATRSQHQHQQQHQQQYQQQQQPQQQQPHQQQMYGGQAPTRTHIVQMQGGPLPQQAYGAPAPTQTHIVQLQAGQPPVSSTYDQDRPQAYNGVPNQAQLNPQGQPQRWPYAQHQAAAPPHQAQRMYNPARPVHEVAVDGSEEPCRCQQCMGPDGVERRREPDESNDPGIPMARRLEKSQQLSDRAIKRKLRIGRFRRSKTSNKSGL